MPILDIIILIVILLSAVIGLVRGLIKEILSLGAWVLSFVVAVMFSTEVAAQLPVGWGAENMRMAIAFVLLFIGSLVVAALLQWLIAQLIKSTGLSGTDRFLGFLFGAARGMLIVMVALIGMREIVQDAPWYEAAKLPPEMLAFEDEVRELLGQAREIVTPANLGDLTDQISN